MTEFFRSFFSAEIWTNSISIIGIFFAIYLCILTNKQFLKGNTNIAIPAIFVAFVTLYIGTRPLWCYSDTNLYTQMFNLVQSGVWPYLPGEGSSEWFFSAIENICIEMTDASGWLLVVATFYVVGMSFAAYRWMPRHIMVALLFLFTAFSFWGYAINGIRNGMATSIALIGLSCFNRNIIQIIIGFVILYIAASTHNSLWLIVASASVAIFLRNTKTNLWVWIACLVLGSVLQNFFMEYFSGLIDDGRMAGYSQIAVSTDSFSRTGIRWDFILYSAMPILLGWYAIIKRRIKDNTYEFMLHVYIFANSFWLLINSIAFSNRFAYISWFMYPILLAYPLCKFKIFKQQGLATGLILLASILFTYIM